jgi:aminoglycoside phosphotransferase (APT) family kinase protein
MHEDEIEIDMRLVHALVKHRLPTCAELALRRLASSGSSNALFRLGDRLLIRLPRQPGGGVTITKEARWLPHIAPHLPVAVPDIIAVCEPACGFPERWSVLSWLHGVPPEPVVAGSPPEPRRAHLADDLASVVTAFRCIDVPRDALTSPELRWYRGAPLATRDEATRCAIEACQTIDGLDLNLDAASAVWDDALRLPGAAESSPPAWYHGDLSAENLLVHDGRLVGVLDFGGLAVGDPTIDLMVAWEVLDAPSRAEFRQAVSVDDAAWLRGRAWALSLALMTFPYYWTTMPDRCASRLAVAQAVLADADSA